MQEHEFKFCADLLRKRSGLIITSDKTYLLESRLLPVARAFGCGTIAELLQLARDFRDDSIQREITEAMTTNESLFFRDAKPFEYLRREILPEYNKKLQGRKLKIWSTACSGGQEPYSIAMCLLEESANIAGMDYSILATDIAAKMLNKARAGIYSQFEVQRGLPIQLLIKYFDQLPGNNWQVKTNLKQMINYQLHNLLDDYRALGKFDIIFCRNVLIYLDEPTRGQVAKKLAGALIENGCLFLGSTESIVDPGNLYEPTPCRGLYRLKLSP